MKAALVFLALPLFAFAEEQKDLAAKIAGHQDGSRKLSTQQDELAADVQQLIIEQTHPKVIELLEGVEDAMDEASELLVATNTGGVTIAAETDVIEKIFEAAKEKQKGQGKPGESGGAMLDMMQEMMGQGKPGDKPGQGKGAGDQGGEGETGDSASANSANAGQTGGKIEARRVPKASGKAGQSLPTEFQPALDAYNRAAEKLAK